MKTKFTVLYFLLATSYFSVFCQISKYDSLHYKGMTRTYLVHIPPGYTNTQPIPLVIALHGGFGSAFNIENQSKLSLKADISNFIVVYPEGIKISGIRTWNAGSCCGAARSLNIDDVGFIDSLIKKLCNDYNIERKKIFATGISNGGMMCYRLANELANRIAAIAPVAATMVIESDCSPSRPVPIIHFHSFKDTNVPFTGGIGSGVSKHYNPPLDSVFKVWMSVNKCLQKEIIRKDSQYLFVKWTDCEDNSEIHLYMTYDGGHSWPGGEKTLIGDEPSEVIVANDLMWEFFETHPMPDKSSNVELNNTYQLDFTLHQNYPNPFNTFTTIYFSLPKASYISLKVFDVLGNEIATLVDGQMSAGEHSIVFDAKELPSGVYFYRLKTAEFSEIKKLLIPR